MTGFSAKSTDW